MFISTRKGSDLLKAPALDSWGFKVNVSIVRFEVDVDAGVGFAEGVQGGWIQCARLSRWPLNVPLRHRSKAMTIKWLAPQWCGMIMAVQRL